MIVHFLNGTAQQRAWFQEAVAAAWGSESGVGGRVWDELNVQLEVEWMVDPGPAGNAEAAYTTVAPGPYGWHARIEINEDLDGPPSELNAFGKPFYLECVVHELAHVAMGLALSEAEIANICLLMGATRHEWDAPEVAWRDRIEEATAEILKDAIAAPANRHFDRTQRVSHDLPAGDWPAFAAMFDLTQVSPEYVPLGSVELAWAETIPPLAGGVIATHVYRATIGGLPYFSPRTYRGVVTVNTGNEVFNLRQLNGRLLDAGGLVVDPALETVAGGGVLTTLTWSALGDLRRPDLDRDYFGWGRWPLSVELEVRFGMGVMFPRPSVFTTFEIDARTGGITPFPPYPTLAALVPSSIAAYPNVPGTRRTPRTVVGA